jgi:hypothetical protein
LEQKLRSSAGRNEAEAAWKASKNLVGCGPDSRAPFTGSHDSRNRCPHGKSKSAVHKIANTES